MVRGWHKKASKGRGLELKILTARCFCPNVFPVTFSQIRLFSPLILIKHTHLVEVFMQIQCNFCETALNLHVHTQTTDMHCPYRPTTYTHMCVFWKIQLLAGINSKRCFSDNAWMSSWCCCCCYCCWAICAWESCVNFNRCNTKW